MEKLNKLPVTTLKLYLNMYHLPQGGNKKDIVRCLYDHLQEPPSEAATSESAASESASSRSSVTSSNADSSVNSSSQESDSSEQSSNERQQRDKRPSQAKQRHHQRHASQHCQHQPRQRHSTIHYNGFNSTYSAWCGEMHLHLLKSIDRTCMLGCSPARPCPQQHLITPLILQNQSRSLYILQHSIVREL